jgi:PAS domain S-box-containing protein
LDGQGKVFNHEVTARTKAGGRITTLVSAEKIELNGRTCVIWTTIDITERKEAEEKLIESEERYRALIDLAPDAILVHHDGNIYYANTSALKLFGASTHEELATHNILDLIHPDDRESASASIQTVEQGKTTMMTERRAIRLDGQPWVLEAAGTPIRWKNELCVQVMIRDITARKKTQEEVARLNRELRAINECDQVIVHAHDEQTLLSDVCRILCTSAGYRMAWVGSVEHDEAKSVRPLAWCGDEEYITNARITWADNERGRGPTGLAVRNNKTHFFQDFASEPAAAPWREAALLKGFRSSIALPLAGDDGKVFAVFTLYSSEPNYFDTAEVKLLEALAGDIAFGIVAIREKVKRQQAEVEIIHLASFPELNPNPVLEIEPDSNIIYANPAAKTHFPLMTKGRKHQFLMDFINSLKKMGTGSITKDIKIGDSWYEETLALVSSTKTYMIYARDITSRKNAEVALQETRDYLNNLLDYANAPIIVWDPSFHITQFNHAFERLIDRTAEDVIGKHLDILFPEEQREHSMEHIRRAVSGERMEVEEITIRHKDNSVRTVLWNSATLYDQDNKTPLATIAQGQDITERKVAEDELKQRTIDLEASNKELEAFSYSVSHDLRAPLRSITGFSNVLLEDYNDELDSEGKSYLKRISDSGELMGQLMDDLLKLSRVTRSELSTEKLDLSEMARKIVRELAEDEPKRKVKVTIAPDMTADGDKNLLGLVLQNLLGNAWKYTSKTAEPRIEMGTIQRNSKMAYFIRDNGVGFDMTYANKLFQPFQRLHKATEFAGTGIGLATVQRIIRRHGGEVWAEAKVGEGATFYFTLD